MQKSIENYSKISHGDYHISVPYGNDPNYHNRDEIYPESFPHRSNTDFISTNKTYEKTHTFDQMLNDEIQDVLRFK